MQIIKILVEPLSIDAFWSVEFRENFAPKFAPALQTLNARKLRVKI